MTVAVVTAIIFLATLIRASLGFGEALVSVPLLAFVLPVTVAAPVAVLVSITVAAVIVATDWRHVDFSSAARLVAASLPGIPIGLWLLHSAPEAAVKILLGSIVALFAIATLRRRGPGTLVDDRWIWVFGAMAGVLGGAYGMNGPPLAVYGALRRWPPERFRATLQGYFLPASLVGMGGYAVAGLWTPTVNRYFVLTLPATAAGIMFGRWLHSRVAGDRFLVYVCAGLILCGAGLIVQALLPH